MSCLFCKIVNGEIPSKPVFEDDLCYAFADINPQAPVHVLVVPREHLDSLNEAGAGKQDLVGHLLWAAAEIARAKGLSKGYRAVITCTCTCSAAARLPGLRDRRAGNRE